MKEWITKSIRMRDSQHSETKVDSLSNIAEILDLRLKAPIPLVLL